MAFSVVAAPATFNCSMWDLVPLTRDWGTWASALRCGVLATVVREFYYKFL